MRSTTETTPAGISSIDAHPRIRECQQQAQTLQRQLEEARAEHAGIVEEREALDAQSVSVLVSLGKVTRQEITARRATLDASVSKAAEKTARLERAIGQLDIDTETARTAIASEIHAALTVELQGHMRDAVGHMAGIEAAANALAQLQQRGLVTPPILPSTIVNTFGAYLRNEAATFGVVE